MITNASGDHPWIPSRQLVGNQLETMTETVGIVFHEHSVATRYHLSVGRIVGGDTHQAALQILEDLGRRLVLEPRNARSEGDADIMLGQDRRQTVTVHPAEDPNDVGEVVLRRNALYRRDFPPAPESDKIVMNESAPAVFPNEQSKTLDGPFEMAVLECADVDEPQSVPQWICRQGLAVGAEWQHMCTTGKPQLPHQACRDCAHIAEERRVEQQQTVFNTPPEAPFFDTSTADVEDHRHAGMEQPEQKTELGPSQEHGVILVTAEKAMGFCQQPELHLSQRVAIEVHDVDARETMALKALVGTEIQDLEPVAKIATVFVGVGVIPELLEGHDEQPSPQEFLPVVGICHPPSAYQMTISRALSSLLRQRPPGHRPRRSRYDGWEGSAVDSSAHTMLMLNSAAKWFANRYRILLVRRAIGRGLEIQRYAMVRPKKQCSFHVVSSERDGSAAAIRCLESVHGQRYPHELVRHIFIDDASTDDTAMRVGAWLRDHPDHRVEFVRNRNRLGMLANNLKGFHLAEENSVGIELNGDDWLPDSGVFRFLNKVYSDHEVWMTYNTLRQTDGTIVFQLPPPPNVRTSRAYRNAPWMTSHLHTFRISLYQQIPKRMLEDPETKQLWDLSQDMAVYLSMLEMAGDHARHIYRITCTYHPHAASDHIQARPAQLAAEARIRSLPPCRPLESLADHDPARN